jgi:hypothetical protein
MKYSGGDDQCQFWGSFEDDDRDDKGRGAEIR